MKEVNIYIEKGKIKDIVPEYEALLLVKKEINAKGNVVFPGFIDPHVHFGDPGFTEREDFKTGNLGSLKDKRDCYKWRMGHLMENRKRTKY